MQNENYLSSHETDGRPPRIWPQESAEYRFWLPLLGGNGPFATWMMLNPSDATYADPRDRTIDRVRHFSRSWKSHGVWDCDGVIVVNVLPYRSPRVKALKGWVRGTSDETFETKMAENRAAIIDALTRSDFLVCAWGATKLRRNNATLEGRAVLNEVLRKRRDLRDKYREGGKILCLGAGVPTHPLARGKHWVSNDAMPNPYKPFD